MAIKCTESMITQALKEMHTTKKKKDIFAAQVKLGRAGSKILDAVAVLPTWSPRTIIGYEIKVSRNDFLNDQKHPVYMETCHLFYFVAPKGIIDKSELPESVGLLEFNPNATTRKFKTVKKAAYRPIDINPDMLLHVLFWKMDEYERPKSREEHLSDIKSKIASRDYGLQIGIDLHRLKCENERLRNKTGENQWQEIATAYKGLTGYNGWQTITPEMVIDLMKGQGFSSDELTNIKSKLNMAMYQLQGIIDRGKHNKEGDQFE